MATSTQDKIIPADEAQDGDLIGHYSDGTPKIKGYRKDGTPKGERKPRNTDTPEIVLEPADSLPSTTGKSNPYIQHVQASWDGNAPADSTDPDNEGAVFSFVADDNERAITLLRQAAGSLGLGVKVREVDGRVYFQARTKRERKSNSAE